MVMTNSELTHALLNLVQHLDSLLHIRVVAKCNGHGIVDHHECCRGHQDLRPGHGNYGSGGSGHAVNLDCDIALRYVSTAIQTT